jgi:hypothetical protein
MWRSLLVEQLGRCPTPTTRQASGGDRHLNFYEARDNLEPHTRPVEVTIEYVLDGTRTFTVRLQAHADPGTQTLREG